MMPLAHAQPNSDAIARFDALVKEGTQRNHVPGTATVVVLGERVPYEKAFGLANLDTSQLMTPETLFRVSGLSKVTTAATLAALAVDGRLKLDAPIGEQWETVPGFLGRITLRQLVQDRAGLRDEHVNFSIGDREDLRRYVLRWDATYVIAEPGRFRSHSSAGANLAAAVAEQVTGTDFADLLDSRLLQPLGMRLTTLRVSEAMTHPFAQGYALSGGQPEVVRPFARNWIGWPSSSVFSSARDGAILLGALVNNGRWDGRQLLSERIVRETLALLEPESDGSITGGHSWFDSRSNFVIVPERHFAVLHLQNVSQVEDAAGRANVMAAARAAWLGDIVPAADRSKPQEIGVDEAQRLAGTYWNEHMLRLEVRAGKLYYRDEGAWYLKPSEWAPIRKVGEDRYMPDAAAGATFTAVADPNGSVGYIRVGSRVFRRQRSGDGQR